MFNGNAKQVINERQMLRPAIVIGPGGTGNQVVRRLKKLVRDHYGDAPMLIHFMVADTHEWLPPALDGGLLDRQDGAGQARMLGRMAFYKSFGFFERRIDYIFTQSQRIQTQLEAMKRYEFDAAADPVIYIVSSVCGGQGAGMVIEELNLRAEEQRRRYLDHFNQAVSYRLNALKQNLTKDGDRLREELTELSDDLNNSRYINGATMRRDVTAEHYAADILGREDRDSLAEMIERLHTAQTNGSLTSRIGEGLQFCLPFWNIRVPGSQYATEVLLVGLEQENTAVRDYLEAHAVAQRGQVYAQIVPTAQDSAILISRIAHGASYYWHAQDEIYFREYSQALTSKNFFLHLRNEWRTLPEPMPEPHKYERRVFALGLAYEFIAVRGSAYYLDLPRQYSLAGTTRHTTADWRTIPLLSAVPPSDQTPQPANPNKVDLIGDGNR